MPVFNPIDTPVDYVLLGGFKSPGFAVVQGLSLTFNWESRKAPGVSGATKVLKGRELTKFSVSFKLFTAQDIADWSAFMASLRYADSSKSTTIKGVDIGHPIAAIYQIKAVTIEKFGPLEQQSDGTWETSIELEEYREPVPTLQKADGSRASKKPEDVDPFLSNPELAAARAADERQQAINKAAGL